MISHVDRVPATNRVGERVSFWFCLLSLAFHPAVARGQADEQSSPIKVTMCELAQHPEQYAGKMVAVHATQMGKGFWIEDFSEKPCSAYTPVMVIYPDKVKPAPGFNLVRDDAFQVFFEEIRKGRHVEATYEGRFDVAYVWRDHKRIYIGSEKGYGEKNRYGARVVLRRISEVVSRPGVRL